MSGEIDKVFAGLDTRLRKFKQEFGMEVVERVKQRTPVVTGEMQAGWGFEMKATDIEIYNVSDHAAYVEYELSGDAQMTVGQSQTGQLLRWSYTLPPELAGTLTNGRFKFGRGLRGRHFSFTLRLDGKQGYINDWQTLFAKSQRRI